MRETCGADGEGASPQRARRKGAPHRSALRLDTRRARYGGGYFTVNSVTSDCPAL